MHRGFGREPPLSAQEVNNLLTETVAISIARGNALTIAAWLTSQGVPAEPTTPSLSRRRTTSPDDPQTQRSAHCARLPRPDRTSQAPKLDETQGVTSAPSTLKATTSAPTIITATTAVTTAPNVPAPPPAHRSHDGTVENRMRNSILVK